MILDDFPEMHEAAKRCGNGAIPMQQTLTSAIRNGTIPQEAEAVPNTFCACQIHGLRKSESSKR
jgi:hypothetical protein